jgi:ribosomal protein S18 acetylase RimI-like enzyme
MTILLHNLLARAPKLNDVDPVTKLLVACDFADDGVSHYTEEDLLATWQKPGFNLATDAKVIVTNKGQLVGYVSIDDYKPVCIDMKASVHPNYRGRGIGTLLLRLAEVRARQQLACAPTGVRVVVHNTVSHANQTAKNLLENEGYSLVGHFWRIVIETNEEPLQTSGAFLREARFKLALDVQHQCATGITRVYEPSGLYIVLQYDVYEKELRGGEGLCEEDSGKQLVGV